MSPQGPRWAHVIPGGTLICRAWGSRDLSPDLTSLPAGRDSQHLRVQAGRGGGRGRVWSGLGPGGGPFSTLCGGVAAFFCGHW